MPWRWLTLPWHHHLRVPAGLPPVHKQWVHSPAEGAEALVGYLEPGQIHTGPREARDPTPVPLPWQEPRVFFSCDTQTSKGPPREAWGCQGREKGLGLKENKLLDCNDFIPYLLPSAIQSLPSFCPFFSLVAVRIAVESLNSLRVFSAAEGKPHVPEGNGRITTGL